MKKSWLIALLVALLFWNLYLTSSVHKLKSAKQKEPNVSLVEGGTTIVQNTLHGFTTDITQVATKSQSKLVTVQKLENKDVKTASGIVFATKEKDVYLLSSATFLDGVSQTTITFDNGVHVEAKLVGVDPQTDVALLVCRPTFQCLPIAIGDTRLVKQGEYVIALGAKNMQTQDGSVSFGVVSRPAQLLVEQEGKTPWITTAFTGDVHLNRDNIGGPLVNLAGEMIGMLSPKMTSLNSVAGLSSATSSNEIVLVAKQLMDKQKVTRGYLGVVGGSVSDLEVYEKSAMNLNLDVESGVYCTYVEKDSPAQIAGFQPGDVLVECNGKTLKSYFDLQEVLYTTSPEDIIEIKILRDGHTTKVPVKLQ